MDDIYRLMQWGAWRGNICIHEDNRQSVWETEPSQVAILCRIRDRFLARGIEALVASVYNESKGQMQYAIFVEDGFLVA